MMYCFYLLLLYIHASFCDGNEFRFANNYGSNMVLQRAPQQAVLWGFGEVGQMVTLSINNTEEIFSARVYTDLHGFNVWKIKLPLIAEFGPFKITATSIWQTESVSVILDNVLFGDVWLCSGQSNMQFALAQSFTSKEEIKMAESRPNIRLFIMKQYFSKKPIYNLAWDNIIQKWTIASNASVRYFSAVCWMYGRRLYDRYKVPIGLVDSVWGGTCAEAWSPKDGLNKCGTEPRQVRVKHAQTLNFRRKRGLANNRHESVKVTDDATWIKYSGFTDEDHDKNQNTVLWNAMIVPHLNTTIKGVLWYQGERNNVINPNLYACVFPSMIDNWRKNWFQGTDGATNKTFPFGFVQLAAIGEDVVAKRPFFPKLRWEQTANYGYVPNARQTNVFMAVAMDLPDDQSPYGTIHPRDKATVADRLILGARSMVYGENVKFQGPILDNCYITKLLGVFVATVQYKGVAKEGMYLKSFKGFEALITGMTEWIQIQIISLTEDKQGVILSVPSYDISAIRYAWDHRPCDYKQCALYSVENQLPAPPAICYIP